MKCETTKDEYATKRDQPVICMIRLAVIIKDLNLESKTESKGKLHVKKRRKPKVRKTLECLQIKKIEETNLFIENTVPYSN